MSYVHSASSITASNPLRRSSGLIFVIALHMLAIAAIKSGLIVEISLPNIPGVRVVQPDIPKPPPLPFIPFTPKDPGKTTFLPPDLPPTTASNPTDETPPPTTEARGTGENSKYVEPAPTVVIARVDPTHPLTQPIYPAASKRGNEQGRVELMLYILANGKVGDAQIAQSSGYSRLDESALREALKSWRFIPQQENGAAVASWQRFAITFRLEN